MNKKFKQPLSKPKYILILVLSTLIIGLLILYRFYSFSSSPPIQKSEQKGSLTNLRSQINNQVKKKKIAYAITVTKDGHFVDGALVLGYSAKKVHDAANGYNSEYDADLIAFVVPSVKYARPVLEAYGWKVLERNLPVALDDIENKEYANAMRNSGCCGADEFLKLWMYTLVDYERVVHLDMDSVIYQNMVGYSFHIPHKYFFCLSVYVIVYLSFCLFVCDSY
jgi:alpha-N-acetylglucosamine transferase